MFQLFFYFIFNNGSDLVPDMGASAGLISYLYSTPQKRFSHSEPCSSAERCADRIGEAQGGHLSAWAKYFCVPAGDLRHTAASWRSD